VGFEAKCHGGLVARRNVEVSKFVVEARDYVVAYVTINQVGKVDDLAGLLEPDDKKRGQAMLTQAPVHVEQKLEDRGM
jgi:hypothetical protein